MGPGWIGVDLDGTLALYVEPWIASDLVGTIGPPLLPMVEKVKAAIAAGREVRIFTARAGDGRFTDDIRAWCLAYIGVELPVTNVKDYGCAEIWDDRARRVVENVGIFA